MPSTTDFISTATTASIAPWVTATAYTVGQYLNESNRLYKVISAHTSAAAIATDVAGGVVEEVSRSFYERNGTLTGDRSVNGDGHRLEIVSADVAGDVLLEVSPTGIALAHTNTLSGVNQLSVAADGVRIFLDGAGLFINNNAGADGQALISRGFTLAPDWQTLPAGIEDWAAVTPYTVGKYVEEGLKLYRCTLAHTASALFTTDSANWVEVSPSNPVAVLLDSNAGVVAETLPAATGSGATRKYVIADKTNSITFAVQTGEYLNEVLNSSYRADNHPVGAELELCDYATGRWSLAIVGAATSISLARYSVRGAVDNLSLVGGPNILPIGSLLTSDLASSGQLVAGEHDPLSWRVGNEITVSKTGRYRVDLNVVHTAGPLVGGNTQETASTDRAGIRINGTSIEWIGIDDSTGLADQMSGFIVRQFTAGDEIVVVANATGATANEDFYVSFAMEELPSTETILAGYVVPTPLHKYSAAMTAGVATASSTTLPLSATQLDSKLDPHGMGVGNTVVIQQAGLYRVDFSSLMSGNMVVSLRVNGVSVAAGFFTATSTSAIQWAGNLVVGDVITLTSASATSWTTVSLVVQQLPDSTVVNPDTVPVEDLDYVSYASSSIGGNIATELVGGRYLPTLDDADWTHKVDTNSLLTLAAPPVGDSFTIKKAGLYAVSVEMVANSYAEQTVYIFRNGIIVATGWANTGAGTSAMSQVGADITISLAVGDRIQFGSLIAAGWSASLSIRQLPSHSIVKYNPGDVEVQNLHYGSISGVSNFTATANTVIPTSAWTTNGNSFGLTVSEAAGTITVAQAGTYRVVAYAMNRSTSNTANNSVAIAKNGVVVYTSPVHTAGNAGAFPLPIRAEEVLTLAAGDVITAFTGEINGTAWGSPYLSVSQEPVGIFVDPDTVPVETLASFSAINNSGQSIADSLVVTVDGWTEDFDSGGNFNPTTGQFIAPRAGKYTFSAGLMCTGFTPTAVGQDWQINLRQNGVVKAAHIVDSQNITAATNLHATVSKTLNLAIGDVVTITMFQLTGAARTLSTSSAGIFNFFSGVEEPTSTVVNPGDVPVQLLDYGYVQSGTASAASVSLQTIASTGVDTSVPAPTSMITISSAVTQDTSGVTVVGNQLVIANTGRYEIIASAGMRFASASHIYALQAIRNASIILAEGTARVNSATTEDSASLVWSGQLVAGDVIDFRIASHAATASAVDIVTYSASLKQLATHSVIDTVSTPVTEWTAYTPTIGSFSGTQPTKATTLTEQAVYKVVGKTLYINYSYYAAIATGATAGQAGVPYTFSIPSGYTIDTTKASIPTVISSATRSGIDGGTVGSGFASTTGGAESAVRVVPLTTTSVGLYDNKDFTMVRNGRFTINTADVHYSFTTQIPIL